MTRYNERGSNVSGSESAAAPAHTVRMVAPSSGWWPTDRAAHEQHPERRAERREDLVAEFYWSWSRNRLRKQIIVRRPCLAA